jgi:hypothetical protein
MNSPVPFDNFLRGVGDSVKYGEAKYGEDSSQSGSKIDEKSHSFQC